MTNKVKLRSQNWFGRKDKLGTVYRNPIRAEGFSPKVFDNKPVIGICILEFPTISVGEPWMRPSTMMFRNLMRRGEPKSIEFLGDPEIRHCILRS